VLLKVYYDQRDIVLAVVVGATLISNKLRNLIQALSFLSQHGYHLSDLLLSIDKVETVCCQDEQVIVGLYLIIIGLWLRNEVLLVLLIANGSAYRNISIYSRNTVFNCNKSIISNDSIVFVISIRGLLIGQLKNFTVGLEEHGCRVTDIGYGESAVLNKAQK